MNYVESDVNKYNDCNSLREQDTLKSNCKILLTDLISKDYLDKDENGEYYWYGTEMIK